MSYRQISACDHDKQDFEPEELFFRAQWEQYGTADRGPSIGGMDLHEACLAELLPGLLPQESGDKLTIHGGIQR